MVKYASDKKPPRRARRKAVPMKLVTMLAELDGEKCMNLRRYSTRLLALARYAKFSSISTAIGHMFNLVLASMNTKFFTLNQQMSVLT